MICSECSVMISSISSEMSDAFSPVRGSTYACIFLLRRAPRRLRRGWANGGRGKEDVSKGASVAHIVSEKDLSVCLCKFETAMRAARRP